MFPIACNAVGDLFALAQLASQIAQALYDSKNAPQEYQELKEEIEIFQIGVMDACKFLEPEFPIKLEPIAEMMLVTVVARCRETLRKIAKDIDKYQGTGKNEVPGVFGNIAISIASKWWNVTWAFNKVEYMTKLRLALISYRQEFVNIFTMSGFHSTKLVQFRQEELRKGVATIQDQVGQLLIRQPVKELGYGWCDVKAVRLLDAFATRIEVLANFCSSYSDFSKFLKFYFEFDKKPGRRQVEKGGFRIMLHGEENIIGPTDWDERVSPGAELEMSISVVTRFGENSTYHECPVKTCRSDNRGITSISGGIQCRRCGIWFTQGSMLDECRITDISSEPESEGDVMASIRRFYLTPKLSEDARRFIRNFQFLTSDLL